MYSQKMRNFIFDFLYENGIESSCLETHFINHPLPRSFPIVFSI